VQARALFRALRSAADVDKVVQDRIISIAQSECGDQQPAHKYAHYPASSRTCLVA
jgi:hypothetical protein